MLRIQTLLIRIRIRILLFHFDMDRDPGHAFQFDTDPDPDLIVWYGYGSGSLPFQKGNVTTTVHFTHLYLIVLVSRSNRTHTKGNLCSIFHSFKFFCGIRVVYGSESGSGSATLILIMLVFSWPWLAIYWTPLPPFLPPSPLTVPF